MLLDAIAATNLLSLLPAIKRQWRIGIGVVNMDEALVVRDDCYVLLFDVRNEQYHFLSIYDIDCVRNPDQVIAKPKETLAHEILTVAFYQRVQTALMSGELAYPPGWTRTYTIENEQIEVSLIDYVDTFSFNARIASCEWNHTFSANLQKLQNIVRDNAAKPIPEDTPEDWLEIIHLNTLVDQAALQAAQDYIATYRR